MARSYPHLSLEERRKQSQTLDRAAKRRMFTCVKWHPSTETGDLSIISIGCLANWSSRLTDRFHPSAQSKGLAVHRQN